MKDGALVNWNREPKHIYILDSKRNKILEISAFCRNIEPQVIMCGVDELSFTIDYKADRHDEYELLRENALIVYEDFEEYILKDISEEDYGVFKTKTVKAYGGQYIFNRRLF